MRILVMDGAATGAQAQAVITCLKAGEDGLSVLATRVATGRGAAEQFPLLARELFAECGWTHAMPELVGVVVGPGSFTGLRASLAFAHGLAAGSGCAVAGVTGGEAVGAALCAAARPLGAHALHCTIARRDRVFVETLEAGGASGTVSAHMLGALDLPAGPLLVAGNAAALVAEALPHRGDLHRATLPVSDPCAIATVALRRLRGELPPRAAVPLYVDAPEAKLPMAGLRPPPVMSGA
ncbi:tRNA (adenosine(37)-N6)-threonylcarbamoyltransferase complex dimerization subunit type 1 TsaB [Komagataeibacter sp. FNDCR2]|uniref:tRNA (adenosine(37)-N6)-threonylcarbamoyltransferase complex dimerization subunit type 1 TsaB n=1 Tax=Komagataeibacter sp. FNDCR2 TaxID=2878682 RepID=UPI001E63FF85|nr:tRNA (adenosine(37)-N6)-threonylcarbamoyltransferase complex dimerization subunit type 1 TsaB [Komagataeibacter sp. FNDCR2]MCE2575843.1 tRNA (adenosine(37)-N6)-threonylcarbamoyltransferase complex dimerization subunit type 1 TsaB [Komagataeibacter sp. FNDCR2]